MYTKRLAITALLLMLTVTSATAKAKKKKPQTTTSRFDYYMLVLSYAPDFCAQPTGDKDPRECGTGRHVGFVVHGLWPQGETSRGPQRCGGSPVSQAIIQKTLGYIPTESLIQHEWTNHGTCSGLSADDYFAALRKARDAVKIPDELSQATQKVQISPAQVESKMAAANPSYPAASFRTSCYRGGEVELQEVRICLSKDFTPRACGQSAGECPAPTMTLLPTR